MDLLEALGLGRQHGAKPEDENVVSFAVYPERVWVAGHKESNAGSSVSAETSSSTASSTGAHEQVALEALRAACMQVLLPHLQGYIWQKDRFDLHLSSDTVPPWAKRSGPNAVRNGTSPSSMLASAPCLWGNVRFGDNVEDEWFIVWLLLQLTKQVPECSVQVWDNDGEFLLIEAAYALPKWLQPESAANRVWLRRGSVHLVPPPSKANPTLPPFPSLFEALDILTVGDVPTRAHKVQALIDERLAGYPAKAKEGMHRARALLPAKLATALAAEPQLVAAAVEVFCNRDAEDMQAASKMSHFPLVEVAPTLVLFSRCLYAQLAQQRFEPPKGRTLPPVGHPMHKAAELGLKLCAGFEMLHPRTPQAASPSVQQVEQPPDQAQIQQHPAWKAFAASLDRTGYFQGNIPGSAEFRRLMQAAIADFLSSSAYLQATLQLSDPGARLQALLQRQAALGAPEALACSTGGGAEDDDSWLEEQAASVDAELARREAELQARAARPKHQRQQEAATHKLRHNVLDQSVNSVQEVDADALASQLRSFVNYAKAGLEGAEVPTTGTFATAAVKAEVLVTAPAGAQSKGVPAAPNSTARQPAGSGAGKAPSKGLSTGFFGNGARATSSQRHGKQHPQPPRAVQQPPEAQLSTGQAPPQLLQQQQVQGVQRQGREQLVTVAATAATVPHIPDDILGDDALADVDLNLDPGSFFSELGKVLGMDLSKELNLENGDLDMLAPALGSKIGGKPNPHAAASATAISARAAAVPVSAMAAGPQVGTAATAAPLCTYTDDGGSSSDDESSSSTEASSFFSDSGSDTEQSGDEREAEVEGVSTEASGGRTCRADHSYPKPDVAWEVDTATDSDDDDRNSSGIGSDAHSSAVGVAIVQQQPSTGNDNAPRQSNGSKSDGNAFMAAYSSEMEAQLAGTTMTHTFERLQLQDSTLQDPTVDRNVFDPLHKLGAGAARSVAPPSDRPSSRIHAQQAAAAADRNAAHADPDQLDKEFRQVHAAEFDSGASAAAGQVLAPVDLDMNLVHNLIKSYTAQAGMAGPASNLAGLLGLSVPRGDVA